MHWSFGTMKRQVHITLKWWVLRALNALAAIPLQRGSHEIDCSNYRSKFISCRSPSARLWDVLPLEAWNATTGIMRYVWFDAPRSKGCLATWRSERCRIILNITDRETQYWKIWIPLTVCTRNHNRWFKSGYVGNGSQYKRISKHYKTASPKRKQGHALKCKAYFSQQMNLLQKR